MIRPKPDSTDQTAIKILEYEKREAEKLLRREAKRFDRNQRSAEPAIR